MTRVLDILVGIAFSFAALVLLLMLASWVRGRQRRGGRVS